MLAAQCMKATLPTDSYAAKMYDVRLLIPVPFLLMSKYVPTSQLTEAGYHERDVFGLSSEDETDTFLSSMDLSSSDRNYLDSPSH